MEQLSAIKKLLNLLKIRMHIENKTQDFSVVDEDKIRQPKNKYYFFCKFSKKF